MSKSHHHKPKPDLKSQKRQNQADNHRSPIFLPGEDCPSMLARKKKAGSHRVGEAPYMDTAHTRQPHFALFFHSPQKPQIPGSNITTNTNTKPHQRSHPHSLFTTQPHPKHNLIT
jgi:hypothetical protein